MIVRDVANYWARGRTPHPNQHAPQDGLLFDGMQKKLPYGC